MSNLVSTNPAKGYEELGQVSISSDKEIEEKVKLAHKAKLAWKELGAAKRIQLLEPFYNEFEKRKDELALLITREIGKQIKESREEIVGGLEHFRYELDHGASHLEDEITHEDSQSVSKIIFEPQGMAAVIAPWNYPFMMFIWGVMPNLIAGNTIVFKHSELCPLLGKLLAEIMDLKKLPDGVFAEIFGNGKQGKHLISQDIDFIWFTGSSAVGQCLYEIAGRKFIQAILEMGG